MKDTKLRNGGKHEKETDSTSSVGSASSVASASCVVSVVVDALSSFAVFPHPVIMDMAFADDYGFGF